MRIFKYSLLTSNKVLGVHTLTRVIMCLKVPHNNPRLHLQKSQVIPMSELHKPRKFERKKNL